MGLRWIEFCVQQDVDQRITRDVERLCDDLSALIPSLVKPVVDIAWFSVQLYQLTGRRGMAILYLYAFLGFGALSAVTPDFGGLARKVPPISAPAVPFLPGLKFLKLQTIIVACTGIP